MLVHCSSCAKPLNVPDNAVGKKAKCPSCATIFEIVAPTAVAAAPLAPTAPMAPAAPPPPPPPLRRREEFEEDDRPRRPRAEDDDDDRPRRRRRDEDDERAREDDDDLPRRKRPGARVEGMAGWISLWLKICCFVLIGYLLINMLNSYLFTSALFRRPMVVGNMQVNFGRFGPSPTTALLVSFFIALVIYGPCITFMFIGASKANQFSGRGFVLAGLIIAIVLGSLMALGILIEFVSMFTVFLTFMQPITLLVGAGAATILLITGIRGVSLMSYPEMKEAFGVRDEPRRPRRRQERDDDPEDDYDDRDDRPRRRRRERDDDERGSASDR